MMIWKNPEKKLPKKRKDNPFLSETVLTYNYQKPYKMEFYSMAFYDYYKGKWYDIMTSAYIINFDCKWRYLPKYFGKIKLIFDRS